MPLLGEIGEGRCGGGCLLHDDYLVRMDHRGEAVGNDDGGLVFARLAQALHDARFLLRILQNVKSCL